jgi:TonB family protein
VKSLLLHSRSGASKVLLGLALAAAWLDATYAQDKPKEIWIHAPIEIAADGKAQIGELKGVSGALSAMAKQALTNSRFLPAHRNGAAVVSSTHLTAILVLTPVRADDYSISLKDINLAPTGLAVAPPLYPADMVRGNRSGDVELRLRIGVDGKPVYLRTVSSSHQAFEKAAIASMKRWKFEPQRIAGRPVEVEVSQPVRFFPRGQPPVARSFECAWDEARPRWEKQTGCLNAVEVFFFY